MEFTGALIWLVQNPTGVIVRGTERCIGLSADGALFEFAAHKPGYARLWVMDIVAADWEPMTREALEARVAQSQQAG